jgi:hypothetical protein
MKGICELQKIKAANINDIALYKHRFIKQPFYKPGGICRPVLSFHPHVDSRGLAERLRQSAVVVIADIVFTHPNELLFSIYIYIKI